MKIGRVKISNPFVLAPMAGVNCTAFRLMCKESGAGLIYTQMYHSDFIIHKASNEGNQAVYDFINIQDIERPVSVQLVGYNPDNMVKAAQIIEKIADIIDINLGCCDPDIIKSGAGAYFAKNSDKIPEFVGPIVKASKKPVTAKIRIGYDSQSINGVSVAQVLEMLGVSAIAVHGRVATQKYSGRANWEIIKHIKQKLSITVLGSGDVKNKKNAVQMLEKTGCDFVMIGRRAIGDPGFFARCLNEYDLKDRKIVNPAELFKRFVELYDKFDKNKSFSELRTHALWFSKRAGLGPQCRKDIMSSKNITDLMISF